MNQRGFGLGEFLFTLAILGLIAVAIWSSRQEDAKVAAIQAERARCLRYHYEPTGATVCTKQGYGARYCERYEPERVWMCDAWKAEEGR